MFKLPGVPSAQAYINEKADFAELLAWDQGFVSARQIVAAMGRAAESNQTDGAHDEEDELADGLDEVMNEINRRAAACGQGYPFTLDRVGTVLRYQSKDVSPAAEVYRYLLLSTRLNMSDDRVHADIDGTHLLEHISAHALGRYLGSARSRSLVFGTASQGSFEDKVNHLCRELGEGDGFKNIDGDVQVHANDDRLDAVAWVPFSDKMAGQMVIFGQCKTGSTWRSQVTQLQSEAFIKRWMQGHFIVNPLRAFCVSEAADRARWKSTSLSAGILFDRCRIVDFCFDLDAKLIKDIKRWYKAAQKTVSFEQS